MVDKCPNCGQPGRPGARFCTSCGFRLPERPVEPEPSPLSRSPFATTSTVAASWWPSSAPAGGQSEPATNVVPADAPSLQQNAALSDADAATASDTSDGAGAEPQREPVIALSDTGPLVADLESPGRHDESAPLPAWPSFPSYGSSLGQPSSWETPAAADAGGEGDGESEDLAAAVDQLAGDAGLGPAGLEPATAESPARETALSEPNPDEQPAVIAEAYEAPPWFAQESAAPTASYGDDEVHEPKPTGDTLGRAQALLDELRSLLPSIAGPAVAAPSVDLAALAADLTSARDAAAPQAQLDALMSVVETAKERPRDIDVMLDLSRHVEAIAALKTAYDRCLGAIDDAVSRMKSV